MAETVLVTGGSGLVGSAIEAIGDQYPEFSFVYTTHSQCDLTRKDAVEKLFDAVKPTHVIHAAARVGGIGRNLSSPAQQYLDNILMNAFVIDCANRHNVDRLLAFSSVCAFPKEAVVLREDILHAGEPFPAHLSYAYAKRMVDVQIQAYKQQYDVDYCSVIPGNMFGEHDNYNLEYGHVIPSLIHKCFLAKRDDEPFYVWGDGSPLREFLYAKDVARVCVDMLEIEDRLPQRLIVSGREYSIREIVNNICEAMDYHNVAWQTDKPNGQLRRPTDMGLFDSIFPDFQHTPVLEALEKSIQWFVSNYPEVRI